MKSKIKLTGLNSYSMKQIDIINNFIVSNAPMAIDMVDSWSTQNFSFLELMFGEPEILSFNEDKSIATIDLSGVVGLNITENKLEKAFDEIQAIETVKGVLLKINSPGGESNISDALAESVQSFKKKTSLPIVSFIDGMAASAGYQLACQSDKVYSSRGAQVGSIGSMAIVPNYSEMKDGPKYTIVKSGKWKNFPNSMEKIDEEGIKKLTEKVESAAQSFFNSVSEARDIDTDEIESWEGDIFNAVEAKSKKLIDGYGRESKAIYELNKLMKETKPVEEKEKTKIDNSLETKPVNNISNSSNPKEDLMTKELQDQITSLESQISVIKNALVDEFKTEYQKAYSKLPNEGKLSLIKSLTVDLIKSELDDLKQLNTKKFAVKSEVAEVIEGDEDKAKDKKEEDKKKDDELKEALVESHLNGSTILSMTPGFNRESAKRELLLKMGGIK
jgi:signal peptide peptidase SppA